MGATHDSGAIQDSDILNYFKRAEEPVLTAPDIADHFDVSQQAAHYRLSKLHEQEKLHRRQVGGRAVVWWIATPEN